MTRIELLRCYDLLDDQGKALVDLCIKANLVEMLREELERLSSGQDDLEGGDKR